MASAASHEPRPDAGQGPCIASLLKGLRVLELVNVHPGIAFPELCRKAKLSEGTVYRMLATLVSEELVKHDPATRGYSVTRRVRALSHGYDSEGWVSTIAWSALRDLGEAIDWPVSLAILSGANVHIRATTDEHSHLVFGVSRAGVQFPIVNSCSGMTLLAHLPVAAREARLALLETTEQAPQVALRNREQWHRHLDSIRHAGWSSTCQLDKRQSFLSFPVLQEDGTALAAITVKYFMTAMSRADALERYADTIRATALAIAEGYRGQRLSLPGA